MKIKIKKIIASVLTFMMIFTQVPLASTNVYAADDNFWKCNECYTKYKISNRDWG